MKRTIAIWCIRWWPIGAVLALIMASESRADHPHLAAAGVCGQVCCVVQMPRCRNPCCECRACACFGGPCCCERQPPLRALLQRILNLR